MKHVHYVPESYLLHCIEGISEVDVLDNLDFLVCGLHARQNAFLACGCWHFDPVCPRPALVLTHLSVPRSFSAARWWCNWAVGTHYWAALPVFDQTFCRCCLLCGVERWCHSWWTDSGARCRWFSQVESNATYEWVMSRMNEPSHIWMSHVIYEWVMPHMNESCHIWMSHVTYAWVMSQMNEACYIWMSHVTYKSVMSHKNEPCHIWMSHDTYE